MFPALIEGLNEINVDTVFSQFTDTLAQELSTFERESALCVSWFCHLSYAEQSARLERLGADGKFVEKVVPLGDLVGWLNQ